MAKTPHQRIMRAAERGTGLRLSADEVRRLSRDDAIATCARNDDKAEIANQCKSCLDYVIPRVEWHCASHEEPPVGRCGDWKGGGE